MTTPDLSIVIPNYNEKANLERGVLDEMEQYLKRAKFSYEVIINDDGSTDGGLQIIDSFVKTHPHYKVIKNSHVGKAGGIWAGIQKAHGKVILFTDMDQSTPLKEVDKLLPWYEKRFDVVFGSRGALRKNFPISRQLMSWGFRTFQIFPRPCRPGDLPPS
jgi:dolichyl-phosphate beta-glucosyltransferase